MWMLAITTDSMRTTALVAILIVVVLAVVSFLVIKTIVAKVMTLVIGIVLTWGLASQRSAISDCVDRVKADSLSVGAAAKTECSFFGIKVTVPSDKLRP